MTNLKCVCVWNECGRPGKHKIYLDGEVVGYYCDEHVPHIKNFLDEKINKMPTAEQQLPYINVPVWHTTTVLDTDNNV